MSNVYGFGNNCSNNCRVQVCVCSSNRPVLDYFKLAPIRLEVELNVIDSSYDTSNPSFDADLIIQRLQAKEHILERINLYGYYLQNISNFLYDILFRALSSLLVIQDS